VGRSERWTRKWLSRFEAVETPSFSMYRSQSRAPKRRPRQTSKAVKDIICDLREGLSEQYHRPAGPTLIYRAMREDTALMESDEFIPSSSRTITEILFERGYIQRTKHYEHQPLPLCAPMEEWEMDFCEIRLTALKEAGCEKLFEETASGAKRNRPQLHAALEYMRPGDTLVVWKLDRLARSLRQLIETVETLEQEDKAFCSLTEAIDTTSPGGKLFFHIFAALAEWERATIRERTHAGLAAARAKGRVGGRPPALSSDDLEVARTMLKDSNITVEKIAELLNVSPSTLYRHLPGGRSAVEEA